ncbi:hypothetical protein IGI04_042188 [Brassica rapa subsp. trilocularis]|uniref:Uncharacterized protein n=1 Tax=Brassica rapa subsp. trilocularis TaxID=1813537 RepID=A0ABQ7KML6_BRACM|nr:hypothetical protein IGI04_042188 [Brassica rapa subsp. trilocularis]
MLRLNLIRERSQLEQAVQKLSDAYGKLDQLDLAQPDGLLAHSAEAAGSQIISARRTVRVSGRWFVSGSEAGHVVHESLGSCGQAVGLGIKSRLGLDVPIRSGTFHFRKGTIWTVDCNRWPRSVPKGCFEGMCPCAHDLCISGKENGLGERRPWGYGYPRHIERSGEGLQPRGSVR